MISSSREISPHFPSELLSQFPMVAVPAEGGTGLLGGYRYQRENVRSYKISGVVEDLATGRMRRDQCLS